MNIRQRTVTTLLAVISVTLGSSSIVGGSPAAGAQPMDVPPCPWDCQAVPSGAVDVPDLLALLAVWGIFAPGHPCDFDNTNVVNVPDLLELLAHWGACPP